MITKRHTPIRFSSLVFLTFVIFFTCGAQTIEIGVPNIEVFSPDDYNAGIITYKISQNTIGYILSGTNKGLVSYDGNNWSGYDLPGNNRVRSFATDNLGRIYIGSQNEIGYFQPNQHSEYVYQSLKDQLPIEDRQFDDVWDIYQTDEGIVFSTVKGIYIYSNEKIRFIPFIQLGNLTYFHRGKIYHQVPGVGLFHLSDDEWKPSNMGQFFYDKEVRAMSIFNTNHDLIATYENGIFLTGLHTTQPWGEGMGDDFSSNKILSFEMLKNGNYAVGTELNGLYILSNEGVLLEHYSEENGLNSNSVLTVYEDTFGNIWLGHNNGISKIELSSPFRYIDQRIGLSGTGYTSLLLDDYLYLGTNNGLYYTKLKKEGIQEPLRRMEGIEGQVYSIDEVNGDVLVGCHFGAYQVTENKARQISSGTGWWTFIPTIDPSLAIAGGYSGLFQLKKTGANWEVTQYYAGFSESCRIIAFADERTLWMSHGYKGVYRIRMSSDLERLEQIDYYNEQSGFPSNIDINLFQINNKLIYPAKSGIYQFDESSNSFDLLDPFNGEINPTEHIRFLTEDNQGSVIFMTNEYSGILNKSNTGRYESAQISFDKVHRLFNDDLENITTLDGNTILFASRDGFVVLAKSQLQNATNESKAIIRRVSLPKTDSTLYHGVHFDNDQNSMSQPDESKIQLEYDDNSIEFFFTSLEFDESKSSYQYRLDGFEYEWSDWTTVSFKEYTNLPEGNYTFEVRSKNPYGIISEPTSYSFVIAPPWYRSPLMKTLYIISLTIFVAILIYKRSSNKKIISKQERELQSKGQELEEISSKSKAEIEKIKNEKLATEIRLKKNQLASTAMHLIDRNEYIVNIRKNLEEAIQESSPQKKQTLLKRLVNDIERNKSTENDWKQFSTHFDEVHNNFSSRIAELHPGLTPQELKLSVYLRMNLSTKEIANLNHVSVRAIEMSRHRLRKKLKLDQGENLIDYLIKI